ncbi:MAG: glycosyltransferase family 25 protein [Woeseiaceae bacterium]|nr:glycosyltransferase family 25 protein [Woeseiaceae bacterium]
MDICVISLRNSSHRRASIAAQFADRGITYRFFDALTPTMAPAYVEGYDEAEFVLNCGRTATDGEIACYASHMEMWRECAAAGRPFLILEDDARLTRSFCAGLSIVNRWIRECGVIRVALPLPKQSTTVTCHDGFALHYCQRVPLQSLGYALSPQAAKLLVREGRTIEEPIDKFMQRFWRHGQRIYALLPAIVEHSLLAGTSDIGDRVRHDYDLATRLRRLVRKSGNALARTYSNAVFAPRPSDLM